MRNKTTQFLIVSLVLIITLCIGTFVFQVKDKEFGYNE